MHVAVADSVTVVPAAEGEAGESALSATLPHTSLPIWCSSIALLESVFAMLPELRAVAWTE